MAQIIACDLLLTEHNGAPEERAHSGAPKEKNAQQHPGGGLGRSAWEEERSRERVEWRRSLPANCSS